MPLLLELPPGYRRRPAADPDRLALLRRIRQFLLAGRLAWEGNGGPPACQGAAP
jgi:hypothetical protein